MEDLKILPASMQFRQVAVTGEFSVMPVSLKHRLRFVAMGNNRQMFDATFEAMTLSNHSVAVAYEPVTVEDQEIINSYGGLANTPAYLVHLRPVLTVDGARLATGDSGLPVGDDFTLVVEMIGPNHTERLENRLIIGNLAVLGLTAQQAVLPEAVPVAEANAERRLYERAMDYIARWNAAEDELASLLHIELARPLPTMVVLGGVVDVAYLLDTPHGFDWKGVYIDAALRVTETTGSPEYCRLFMQLSSLQGSVLENKIFEDGFGVESISTAKLLGLANAGSVPLVVLDQGNVSIEMPGLNLPANISVDIENAINQGLKVTIPELETQHEDWLGYGYLKEDPATGESGWMLSGMIAGGMTALNPERWPAEYYDPLANPLQGEVNHDPDSAVELVVLAASEGQQGVVGNPLPLPLQIIARDAQMRPVSGVQVDFRVLAGGGILSQISVSTDSNGIASVTLTLGQHIADNPTSWYATPHNWTVGENIVDAATTNGLRLSAPITAFAFPGDPDHLNVYLDQKSSNSILSWAGPLGVKIEDRYGNNISNEPVTFTMGDPVPKVTCEMANTDNRPGLLAGITDACFANNVPMYGECGDSTLVETTSQAGAAAQVFLGAVSAADYPVTIRATGARTAHLPAQTVTVTSLAFGNCDGLTSPEVEGALQDISLVDQLGHVVNAAKVGGSVPVMVRMYLLRELEGGLAEGTLYCPEGVPNRTCAYPLGTRQYVTDTNLSGDSFVEIAGGIRATPLGQGLFDLDYPVGDTPGINNVVIRGEARTAVNVTLIQASCDEATGAGACGLVQGPTGDDDIRLNKSIIAVDFELPRTSYAIPVDSEGYALVDTQIGYTILPYVPGDQNQSYRAGNAFVEIAKKKPDGSLEVERYLDTEPTGPGTGTLARSFRFEPDTEYVARVVLNKASNAVEIRSNEISLTPVVVNLDLVPDYNRDGKIDDQDRDKVANAKPWRFWVNDDKDKTSDPISGLGGDDTPGAGPDYQDATVNGIRDLVDFFPLHLDIAETLAKLPPAAGYSYYLRNNDSAVGVVESPLLVAESNYYLEDLDVAAGLRGSPVGIVDDKGLMLSPAFLAAIVANPHQGVLLVEGRNESTAPLVLEVRGPDGAVVIAQDFPLEIVPVSAMTGHKDLRPVAGGSGGDPSRIPESPPYAMTEDSNKVLVWMHGYNVSPIEARATYAEVFKRFFHAGLMGTFYGVSWFGDPPDGTIAPIPHYHQAAVNAFATARDFGVFVEGLGDEVSIAAHSLGNLVAGSAIQDQGLTRFNKYFAIDAAVALEAYGQTAVDEGMVTVDSWLDFWKYEATDAQGNPVTGGKFLASEWYKRFENDDPVDNRKYLTWRNRLDKVPSSKLYNFYSSTEEVLRSYPGDDIATVLGLLQNITALKEYLSISTWVKQEKYKGRSLTPNAGGVSSPFAGWSFSGNYWKFELLSIDHRRHYTPEEAANEISADALRSEPFFARDTSLFSSHGLDNLTAPDGTGTLPSDFVMKTVSGTGLAGYYTDNAPAQDRIKVRDWLLAEAFPATTLPMGANLNGAIKVEQNIDMSGVRNSEGGCCKTEELRWPRNERYLDHKEWRHSDYKDIAFQHVYGFYSNILQLSE